MARFLCKCGEVLSTSLAPNNVQLRVYTDEEWDQIINQECINPIIIPLPKFDVWRCPHCERLYVFKDGEDQPIKRYVLELD